MPKKSNDPEDLPLREGGAFRRFGYNANKDGRHRHSYNFNSACRNFLNSRLGHNWDNVYSYICAHHEDKDKARMFAYIKKHIDYFVDFNVTEEDGVLFNSRGRKLSTYRTVFYLKKGEKILKKFENHYKYKRPTRKFYQIEERNFIKFEGIWYEFTYTQQRKCYLSYTYRYDCFFKRDITEIEAYFFYGIPVVATSKKQLSSKEIKRLKLNELTKGKK